MPLFRREFIPIKLKKEEIPAEPEPAPATEPVAKAEPEPAPATEPVTGPEPSQLEPGPPE